MNPKEAREIVTQLLEENCSRQSTMFGILNQQRVQALCVLMLDTMPTAERVIRYEKLAAFIRAAAMNDRNP